MMAIFVNWNVTTKLHVYAYDSLPTSKGTALAQMY